MSAKFTEQLVKAWNSGNIKTIGELYAKNARMQHPMVPQGLEGRAQIEGFEGPMFSAFSELAWKAKSVVTEGSKVAVEFEVTALNSGAIPSPKGMIPATGKRITVAGTSMMTLDGEGRIAEEHRYLDTGSMFVQLGLAG
jgi:steroid delta-isomerase-like uncharacterized protein